MRRAGSRLGDESSDLVGSHSHRPFYVGEAEEEWGTIIPLRAIGVPDDLVAAVVYLASNDEARLATGASLFIDAGRTIWGA